MSKIAEEFNLKTQENRRAFESDQILKSNAIFKKKGKIPRLSKVCNNWHNMSMQQKSHQIHWRKPKCNTMNYWSSMNSRKNMISFSRQASCIQANKLKCLEIYLVVSKLRLFVYLYIFQSIDIRLRLVCLKNYGVSIKEKKILQNLLFSLSLSNKFKKLNIKLKQNIYLSII